jgi:predicted nucleic acid-binding protein
VALADTSAWVWSRRAGDALRERFDQGVRAGLVATCDMVRFEIMASARDAGELAAIRFELSMQPSCQIAEPEWSRALDVYESLGALDPGRHRAIGHQDLLIAAAAEAARVPVLHYDSDYDLIAGITGQPMLWLAPRGSLG